MALKRRHFLLAGFGLVGFGGLLAWVKRNTILRSLLLRVDNSGLAFSAAPPVTGDACMLTTHQGEGPFFFKGPLRSDIREDKPGQALNLTLQLVAADGCTPLDGALVEVWHCDAAGVYSGYPKELARDIGKALLFFSGGNRTATTNDLTFLRGAQITDANGLVKFDTIFPGWYDMRTPHIHFRITRNLKDLITSQLYFEPEFFNRLYRENKNYQPYGESPYLPVNDTMISLAGAARGLMLHPEWPQDDGAIAVSAKIGIRS